MPEIVTNHREAMWSQSLWDSINDGGRWIVPRSGLTFQKDEATMRMKLVDRLPWHESLGGTAEDLKLYQDSDFEAIRKRFALIGVECSL